MGRWSFILILTALTIAARSQTLTESQLSEIRFDQKPGSQISPGTSFRDENGKAVKVGDYFGRKPVVLMLGYYQCPMLCTLTFNGMIESMQDLKWSIGDQFTVIHVSIDPGETSRLAKAKKETCLKRYGRSGAADGWHFLTGDESSIHELAEEIGFHYAYDSSVRQYAHPSGLVIVTPDGKVAKYLFGVTFAPKELYAALQDASDQKVGSPVERLVLLCFHYSPLHGKYSGFVVAGVRVLGGATLAVMAWLFTAMIRREKRKGAADLIPPARPLTDVPGEV